MSDKFLPIKIFEKRKKYDDRETEGGGDSREPKFVLHGEELLVRANMLSADVLDVKEKFVERKKNNKKLPMVVSTTIEEAALAKSYRGKITNILESDGKDNVIGFYGDRQILSMVTDEVVLDNISSVMQNASEAMLISSIAEIEEYKPFVETYDNEKHEYRVRLIDYNDFNQNELARIIFKDFCDVAEIKISREVRFTSDMYIFRVTIDSLEKSQLLEEFEGLYSAEITTPIEASLDCVEDTDQYAKKIPDEYENYPVLGILDTGIESIDTLQPWIEPVKHTNYPSKYENHRHGTFVSGIAEYVDELNNTEIESLEGIRLFDATVYPDQAAMQIYPEELVDNIRDAIERNPEIKIWNLSLGTSAEAELDEFSEFGIALDNIQDENDVLIIKSAGNCLNFTKGLPKSRISKSADSIRSIVVGSIAQSKGLYDYSDLNMPSPFTRVGPGPASIIKPDLVFYGGNAGMKDEKLIKNGVNSFGVNDQKISDSGTSFSTPAVSRIAAELSFIMNEDFDSLMIRALMIHYAKYPDSIKMKMSDKIAQMGFGVPIKASDILYNSPDEITLILRDTLDKGSFIEMFDFPYPTSLVDENGYYTGQIILTLVNKSLVNDKQAGEYCQSNVDVMFGTYENEKDRTITNPRAKNQYGVDENQNVLSEGLYNAKAKGIHPANGFERECTLVKYGKKYHPVKKYAVNLDEMTQANRDKWLPSGRKWYLKIEGLFRDFIEKDAIKRDYQLSQDYCMILTIRDPNKKAPVYDEVSQQLTNRNFIHHDVRVRNVLHVGNDI